MKKVICTILFACLLLAMLSFSGCERVTELEDQEVLTSIIGDETLRIIRNHEEGPLGFHCTVFTIEIYEGDKLTYRYRHNATPCEGIRWTNGCDGRLASLETASKLSDELKAIYPYVEDIQVYTTIHYLHSNNLAAAKFKEMLSTDIFGQILQGQTDDVISRLKSGAISKIAGSADAVTKYMSKVYEVQSKLSEAAELYRNTDGKDLGSLAYVYQPVTEKLVDGFNTATDIVDICNPYSEANTRTKQGHEELQWKPFLYLHELASDGRALEFQTTDTHLQWRCIGDSEWNDLVETTTEDGRKMIFQITKTQVQWRYWTDNEELRYLAQLSLHEKVKTFAEKVG